MVKKLPDYQQLNQLVGSSDAIRTGDFYDLQMANTGSRGYNQARVFSYLRYSANQKLLIICNFDKKKAVRALVKIPAEAWLKMSTTKTHSFTDIFRTKTKLTGKDNVAFELPPLGVLVLEVR